MSTRTCPASRGLTGQETADGPAGNISPAGMSVQPALTIRYAKVGSYCVVWLPDELTQPTEVGRRVFLLDGRRYPDRVSGAYTFNSREWAVLVGRAAVKGWRLVEAFSTARTRSAAA